MAGFTHACLMAVMCLAFFSALVESVPVVDSSTFSASVASSIKRHRHVDPRVQYMRTLAKYNIPVPEKLRKIATTKMSKMAKPPTDDGLQAVSVDGDEYFIAPVGIGSPPQQLYLDFDTGSSDSWVFSTDTDVSEVKGQTIYDPLKSSTAVLLPNTTWEIVYGDFSSSSGIVYKDTLSLGSMNIVNMTIESAQDVSSTFTKDFKMSGLLGLAWPSIAQTMPVQDVLLDYLPQMLKEPLFTVDLRHNSDKGSYNFGFIDHNLHGSQIQYINIDNSEGFWGVQMTGYAISGQDVRYEFSTPKSVIVDTGTTLFYAPQSAVEDYFRAVPNANFSDDAYGYILPCNSTPPDFIWEIGDVTGERIVGRIPGSYIAYQSLTDAVGEDEPWDPSFEGQCYAGLQSLGGFSTPDGILGDVWLKAGFHVFDVANKKFGTAPKPLDSTNKKLGHFRRDKLPFYRKKKIGV
ncbi:aspartic peptidase domain-containing protein [Apiospora arundinis]|uniref:Aspartic peptidase domain-containing protein n=1 Tax=Apiospora arundinis TaxID=335852 RepID=A0ABR2II30_9PEZI